MEGGSVSWTVMPQLLTRDLFVLSALKLTQGWPLFLITHSVRHEVFKSFSSNWSHVGTPGIRKSFSHKEKQHNINYGLSTLVPKIRCFCGCHNQREFSRFKKKKKKLLIMGNTYNTTSWKPHKPGLALTFKITELRVLPGFFFFVFFESKHKSTIYIILEKINKIILQKNQSQRIF